jgi:methyltransferase (TIGR00027 family)
MAETLIGDVLDTAFWIAHYRALESGRRDALFRDPLAGLLAGERGEKIARSMPMSFWTSWTVVMRTCIIDDFIRWAIANGVDTVLNLGAGLDTRPYRMDLPQSLVWVEADFARMIEYKQQRLAAERPRCRLERVKVDLSDLVERRRMLASVDGGAKKMAILTEGVIPYLTEEQVGSLADDLRMLGHAPYWIAEYHSPETVKYRKRSALARRLQNAPFQFDPKDWFGFFREHGWRPREIRYLMDETVRRNRTTDFPLWMRFLLRIQGLLSSPASREAFRRMTGYVILEGVDDTTAG